MESHLLQMRGLKQAYSEGKSLDTVSHLLQMRGLKPRVFLHKQHLEKSHLLQMRGLKQLTKAQAEYTEGRIFYRCVD